MSRNLLLAAAASAGCVHRGGIWAVPDEQVPSEAVQACVAEVMRDFSQKGLIAGAAIPRSNVPGGVVARDGSRVTLSM